MAVSMSAAALARPRSCRSSAAGVGSRGCAALAGAAWLRLLFLPAATAGPAVGMAASGFGGATGDQIESLPDYGAPKTRHLSGYSDATADGKNKLFYYFVEADIGSGSSDTPFLIWLNGGPGASSLMGLFVENLGPLKISPEGKPVDNENRPTRNYHVMAVDNPVGAGFAYTESGAYVKSEQEMREQFVHALRGFFDEHPEYKSNPLWVTGESYAGKYVPNIAYEIARNAKEIPLQGIIVGNGMFNEPIAYTSVSDLAFGEGIISERLLAKTKAREASCLEAIYKQEPEAGDFCENVTVRWLYTGPEAQAGELFYYDFGVEDAGELDVITAKMGSYLNRDDVRRAVHAPNSTWQNADETGPVAKALAADFVIPSAPVIADLLEMGKEVTLYNGVRDGSVCNHIGNLRTVLALDWSGREDFAASENEPWPSRKQVMGHIRGARNLRFATVMRTGHLVPMVVPKSFETLLAMALSHRPAAEAELVV